MLPFLPCRALNGRMEPADGVRRAADPNRLLPGENPKSTDPEDALHWVAVYEELYRFKAELIGQTRARLARMPADAQREVKDTDLAVLLAESERLGSRLDYWKARCRHLQNASASGF